MAPHLGEGGDYPDLKEAGTELFDTEEKLFPDVKAEPGEQAYTFMHTVPYEGSVGLVNLLTTTRPSCETIRISQGLGIWLLPLHDQPSAKVVKAIVGASPLDDVCSTPQIGTVRFIHQLPENSVKAMQFLF